MTRLRGESLQDRGSLSAPARVPCKAEPASSRILRLAGYMYARCITESQQRRVLVLRGKCHDAGGNVEEEGKKEIEIQFGMDCRIVVLSFSSAPVFAEVRDDILSPEESGVILAWSEYSMSLGPSCLSLDCRHSRFHY